MHLPPVELKAAEGDPQSFHCRASHTHTSLLRHSPAGQHNAGSTFRAALEARSFKKEIILVGNNMAKLSGLIQVNRGGG